MLASGAGFVVAALLWVSCAWSSYVAAARLFPQASTAVRFSAQLVIAWYGLVAMFFALATFGGFRAWVAIPLCFAIAGACARGNETAVRQLRTDLQTIRLCWASLGPGVRAVAAAFGLLLLARLARGMVAPPLAWDSLTYHLVHATRFVQAGGFLREVAPDNWSFYEFFPTAGEVLWAWAMLPVSSDALIAPAGVGVVVGTLLTAYACARSLEVSRECATLMAISIAGSPAILTWATSGYVDNFVVALTAAGSLFIVRNGERPNLRDAALAMAAFGLAASAKLTALPLVAFAGVALAVQTFASNELAAGPAQRVRMLAISALPAGVCLVHLVRTWLATGNPLYPFAVDLLGVRVFDGNAEWQWRLVELGTAYRSGPEAFTTVERAIGMFWPFGRAGSMDGVHLSFGPSGLAILALAVVGGVGRMARWESRVATLFLAAVAAIAIYGLTLSPGSDHLQLFYSNNAGRYLGTALFALAVLAATVRVAGQRALWIGIAVVALVVGLPRGTSSDELPAAISAALALLGLLVLGVRLLRNATDATALDRTSRLAVIVMAIAVLGAGIEWARADLRFRVYAASARQEAFDGHTLWPNFASSWTIWEAIDPLPSQRIAVSTGWAGLLHNGYRYPLFGSRLQHDLVYITPTRSGEIVDSRLAERLRREADYEAWLERLIDADVTLVVTLAPDTRPESAWAKARPELFSPLAMSTNGRSRAYRFNRERASAFQIRD